MKRLTDSSRVINLVFVFLAAWILTAVSHTPILNTPLSSRDDIVVVSRALSASWSDLLLGHIDWDLPYRSFRLLPVLTYRLDSFIVDGLGPGFRLLSTAWISTLAVAAYQGIVVISKPLTRFQYWVAALVSLLVPISFAAAESASLLSYRTDGLMTLFLILLGSLLMERMTDGGNGRYPWLIILFVFGAAISKETGVFIAVVLVGMYIGISYLTQKKPLIKTETLPVLGMTILAVIIFYSFKYYAFGSEDLLFASSRQVGTFQWQWVYNVPRSIMSVVAPLFDRFGNLILRRALIALPHLLLAAVVLRQMIYDKKARPLLLFCLGAVVVGVSQSVYSFRPRALLAGYSFWVLAVGIAVISWLQSDASLKAKTYPLVAKLRKEYIVAGTLIVVLLINGSISYHFSVQNYSHALGQWLYTDEPFEKTEYTKIIESQRETYNCKLLPDYRQFLAGRSALSDMAELTDIDGFSGIVELGTTILVGPRIKRYPQGLDQWLIEGGERICLER